MGSEEREIPRRCGGECAAVAPAPQGFRVTEGIGPGYRYTDAAKIAPRTDELTRICLAPVQMLAHKGILVIDDFGRQCLAPRELLKRWIVPLDRGVDYFSLWTGVRFSLRCAGGLRPNPELHDPADEAFMRRIRNQVRVGSVLPEAFWRTRAGPPGARSGVQPGTRKIVRKRCTERAGGGIRVCYPRDLEETARGLMAFDERGMTPEQADMGGCTTDGIWRCRGLFEWSCGRTRPKKSWPHLDAHAEETGMPRRRAIAGADRR